jgi:hypothetical protein
MVPHSDTHLRIVHPTPQLCIERLLCKLGSLLLIPLDRSISSLLSDCWEPLLDDDARTTQGMSIVALVGARTRRSKQGAGGRISLCCGTSLNAYNSFERLSESSFRLYEVQRSSGLSISIWFSLGLSPTIGCFALSRFRFLEGILSAVVTMHNFKRRSCAKFLVGILLRSVRIAVIENQRRYF